jgi:protein tyrosine/serine phosphatase
MPWSGFDWPDHDRVNEFLKLASDPKNYPMHVHCEKGKERTGVMIACYRERFDHWKFEQAYSEMLRYGFDEAWYGHLRAYVKEFNEFKNREDETMSFGWFLEDAKSEFLVMLYSLRKLVS